MKEEQDFCLPKAFLEKMKGLLGETEYKEFLDSYEKERVQGLRLNPLKWNGALSGFEKIPWAGEGYYYDADTRPGKHPLHEAGAYYIQEPSAMAVAELLEPQPGDRVLDLCAAPGGKTTQIAGKMGQKGLLVSNEIHPARAKILSQNVERMGIANCVVTNEDSYSLSRRFPEFFDKIVVDAPCSGEGMFRKDEQARREWSLDNVALCAARQAEILDNAAEMLKEGGRLVYSTCTFSPEENEKSIWNFLCRHPEFSVEIREIPEGFQYFSPGRPEWAKESPTVAEGASVETEERRRARQSLERTFRIWPHRTEGEGHYLACLRKAKAGPEGEMNCSFLPPTKKAGKKSSRNFSGAGSDGEREMAKVWKEFAASALYEDSLKELYSQNQLMAFGDHLYAIPKEMTDLKGLKVLRPGLDLGIVKTNRFEPSHALALYLKKDQSLQWFAMPPEGGLIQSYLRGETIDAGGLTEEDASWNLKKNGWVLMAAGPYSIGWAKLVGNTLKNHYPKGLRRP